MKNKTKKRKMEKISKKFNEADKKFSLKKEYQKSWQYIKETKNFIWIVVGIFLAFVLIGYFVPVPDYIAQKILKFIEEIIKKTEGMSAFQLIKFIFLNNIQSSFFGILFGVLFGIFPLISAITNGYMMGFVSSMVVKEVGILSLWRLLPHGIFELPAVFLSFSLGLKLGVVLFNRKKFGSFRKNILSCIKIFLLIIVPLLIIAAFIEGIFIFWFPN